MHAVLRSYTVFKWQTSPLQLADFELLYLNCNDIVWPKAPRAVKTMNCCMRKYIVFHPCQLYPIIMIQIHMVHTKKISQYNYRTCIWHNVYILTDSLQALQQQYIERCALWIVFSSTLKYSARVLLFEFYIYPILCTLVQLSLLSLISPLYMSTCPVHNNTIGLKSRSMQCGNES